MPGAAKKYIQVNTVTTTYVMASDHRVSASWARTSGDNPPSCQARSAEKMRKVVR